MKSNQNQKNIEDEFTINDILIEVDGIGKKFCRDLKRSLWYGILDIIYEFSGKNSYYSKLRYKEFWALNKVSFSLKKGEVLGLIGGNGAGKTTLLKILNGLIKPDNGVIHIKGKVGALIALGAGFNPILTGKENIYINAAVLGLTKKETDNRFNEIVDFADLWDFIDTPVQSYSSGMQVRLGFAIATALDPDILIIDEILAVGDASFRNKCYNKISELSKEAAVIFVSHNMNDIARICDKCLVLENGNVMHFGNTDDGIRNYLNNLKTNSGKDDSFEDVKPPISNFFTSFEKKEIKYGEKIEVVLTLISDKNIPGVSLQIPFYDETSNVAGEWYSNRFNKPLDIKKGSNKIKICLGPIHLKNGRYKISFFITDSSGFSPLIWSYKMHSIHIDGPYLGAWSYQLSGAIN